MQVARRSTSTSMILILAALLVAAVALSMSARKPTEITLSGGSGPDHSALAAAMSSVSLPSGTVVEQVTVTPESASKLLTPPADVVVSPATADRTGTRACSSSSCT